MPRGLIIQYCEATDFYRDVKTSSRLASGVQSLPHVLEAFGVPADFAGRCFIEIASQEPGKVTGETYRLLSGWRMIRGIALMAWYRAAGKIR